MRKALSSDVAAWTAWSRLNVAAKLYAALVILNADAERLSVMRAEDKVTHDLVTLSSTIVRLMNAEPSRPYSGHKVDFHKVAKDIELRFSRANGFYRDNKYMLGL